MNNPISETMKPQYQQIFDKYKPIIEEYDKKLSTYKRIPILTKAIVTKSNEQVDQFAENKRIANLGCDICPCCGEDKKDLEYSRDTSKLGWVYRRGISSLLSERTWVKGVFRTKYMKQDCYKCWTCGAEWMSQPYQYG